MKVLVEAGHGMNSWQVFAQRYAIVLTMEPYASALHEDTLAILLSGWTCPGYYDTKDKLESFTSTDGMRIIEHNNVICYGMIEEFRQLWDPNGELYTKEELGLTP